MRDKSREKFNCYRDIFKRNLLEQEEKGIKSPNDPQRATDTILEVAKDTRFSPEPAKASRRRERIANEELHMESTDYRLVDSVKFVNSFENLFRPRREPGSRGRMLTSGSLGRIHPKRPEGLVTGRPLTNQSSSNPRLASCILYRPQLKEATTDCIASVPEEVKRSSKGAKHNSKRRQNKGGEDTKIEKVDLRRQPSSRVSKDRSKSLRNQSRKFNKSIEGPPTLVSGRLI